MTPETSGGEREHPIPDGWGLILRAERKRQGYTQTTLAEALGRKMGRTVSQAMISEIEKGTTKASSLVLPLCRLLKIPPPTHGMDELDAQWLSLGAALRYRSEPLFRQMLATVKATVDSLGPK